MGSKTTMPKLYAEDMIKRYFDPKHLRPSGRLQFFFHSPSSDLPVRDVCNEQGSGYKTEPHLEQNAENYLKECYQRANIQGVLKNREKYLLLFTTCKSRSAHMQRHFGERYIVGYIRADRFIARQGFIAIQGRTKVVSFDEAYSLEKLDPSASNRHIRLRRLSEKEVKDVLGYLRLAPNIKGRCIREIERLKTSCAETRQGKCK